MTDTAAAERQVVGIVMQDPAAMMHTHGLRQDHFSDPAARALWGVLSTLYLAGQSIGDPGLIIAEAKRQGAIEEIGGPVAIGRVYSEAGLASSVPEHVALIRRRAELDRIRLVAQSILHQTSDYGAEPEAIIGRADAELHATTAATSVQRIGDVLAGVLHSLRNPETLPPGVPTGLPSIDLASGGLHPGELLILAARPSVGKSALGAGMAVSAAEAGHPALLVSLEMTGRDIAMRLLASRTGDSVSRLRRGDCQVPALDYAAGELAELPLSLWSERGATIDKIRSIARLEQARGRLDLLVVDYIGLVRPSDPRKPRWEAMTEISGELKTLALQLGIPVVALCQLNREAEGQRPKLSHLREAGAIEQDADIVWLLERERDSSEAVLHVAKIRNGSTGQIDLHFDGRGCRFTDAETVSAEPRSEFEEYRSF